MAPPASKPSFIQLLRTPSRPRLDGRLSELHVMPALQLCEPWFCSFTPSEPCRSPVLLPSSSFATKSGNSYTSTTSFNGATRYSNTNGCGPPHKD